MSKKADLAKNTLILALGRGATQIAAFLLIPIYTQHLTPEEYGVFDLIITYAMLFAPVLTLQLEMAAFRLLIDARSDLLQKRKIVTTLALFDTVILFGLGFVVLVLYAILAQPMIWLIYAYVIFFIYSGLFLQIARGLGQNKDYALASIFMAIVLPAMVLVFVVSEGMAINGVLLSLSIAYASSTLFIIVKGKIYRLVRLSSISRNILKDAFSYSLPLVPNGAAIWAMGLSDRTVITIILGSAANGIYAVASRFSAIFSAIFNVFYMSWTEAVSINIGTDSDKFISKTLNAATLFFATLGIFIIIGVQYIFDLFVGADFSESYEYVPVLIVAVLIGSMMSTYGSIYIALKRTKKLMATTIIVAVCNIVLSILLTLYMGLFGPAVAMVISYTTIVLYRHHDLKKYVHLEYNKMQAVGVIALYALVFASYYLGSRPYQLLLSAFALIGGIALNHRTIKSLMKVMRAKNAK